MATLLDDKKRMYGTDVASLDKQVAEKARIRAMEKEREALYDEQMVRLDKECLRREEEVRQERYRRAKEVAEFRLTQQGCHTTREWDLNQTKRTKGQPPQSAGGSVPPALDSLGLASMQNFAGEDLVERERKKVQMEQMATWMREQVLEKDQRKQALLQDQQEFAERAQEVNLRALEQDRALAHRRRELAVGSAQFNKELSETLKMKSIRDRYREQQANMKEIQLALDSDLLTENKEASLNATDLSRYRPDGMKGFLPQQTQAILEEQETQRQQRVLDKAGEKAEEKLWANAQHQQWRAATLLERAKTRQKKALALALNSQHKEMASSQASTKAWEEKVFANDVQSEFHGRFGSSLR